MLARLSVCSWRELYAGNLLHKIPKKHFVVANPARFSLSPIPCRSQALPWKPACLLRKTLFCAKFLRFKKKWCGRVDSNHHGIATASPSSWCVCQFRHDRTEEVANHCSCARRNGQGATDAARKTRPILLKNRWRKFPAHGLAGVAGTGCCGVVDDCGAEGCWVAGAGVAGVAGLVAAGAGFENFCKTEPPCSTERSTRTTRAKAQIINITAHQVVAWESTVAAPRGPKAVWLPAPPKAPARSAALPLCSSTTMISTRQFITKNAVSSQGAQRKPSTMMPKPTSNEIVHFIQAGISCTSILSCNSRRTAGPQAIAANPSRGWRTTWGPDSLRPRARHRVLPAPSIPECCQA
jgi:hypothetical protein